MTAVRGPVVARWLALVLLVGACAMAAGCHTVAPEFAETRRAIGDLRMGASHDEVVERLGPPKREEYYRLSPDRGVTFLFYRTGPSRLTSSGEDQGLTPVAISNMGLERTSTNYYHDIRRRFPRIQ